MRAATGNLVVFLLLLTGCRAGEERAGGGRAAGPDAAPAPPFIEGAAAAGLDFVHLNGMAGDYHMAELMGSGVALFDYDGDGDLDLYLVQGASLDGGRVGAGPGDRLYRNETAPGGPIRFADATAAAGELGRGYGMGVAAGDYDNDGWTDLYVTAFGPNRLLHNQGDGTFRDATSAAGAGDDRWSVPATFFDYDGDGWLDLFVGNYLVYRSPADHRACADATGHRDYCGAVQLQPEADRLLHNRGGGIFAEATAATGLTGGFGRALGAAAADFDGDGRLDLYVGNDAGPNNLWLQVGDGAFEDRALLAGVAVNGDGKAEASMGMDAADCDRDGDLDLFLTHLVVETNTLFENLGGGRFADATAASGLGPPSRRHTGFGTRFLDYDGDGWLDLLVVNGAVQNISALVAAGDPFPFHETNQLFRNLGADGAAGTGPPRFAEVSAVAGAAFASSESSRGVAFGDLDDDGDIDVVIVNNHGPVRLLVNQIGNRGRWVGLRLTTGAPPRDALGARVAVRLAGAARRWARVASDGSYASASDPRLLFALGTGESPAAVEVRWPDGGEETFPPPPVGRYTTLQQGRGESS